MKGKEKAEQKFCVPTSRYRPKHL